MSDERPGFQTPSWMGPDRNPVRTAHEALERNSPTIPAQGTPIHESVPELQHPDIPATAHWVESAKPRLLAGLLLFTGVAGALACLAVAVVTQQPAAIVGLVACAFLAVLCRGAMMSAGLTTADLRGSVLTVHRDGYADTFDLAGPTQLVELVSTPGRRDWRLRLETVDGRVVELGPAQVDPVAMHEIVTYYRAVANRKRRDRDRRMRG